MTEPLKCEPVGLNDIIDPSKEELLGLLVDIKKDLLMRADVDSNGLTVVGLSHSIWLRLKKVTGEAGGQG